MTVLSTGTLLVKVVFDVILTAHRVVRRDASALAHAPVEGVTYQQHVTLIAPDVECLRCAVFCKIEGMDGIIDAKHVLSTRGRPLIIIALLYGCEPPIIVTIVIIIVTIIIIL